jgi:hypothetical protein
MMSKNLVVAVVGNRNSGKSATWNALFGRTVRTGSEIRRLFLRGNEYVEVFLVSGSPEERGLYVGDIITRDNPRIVLCSMQYREDVIDTINYFTERDYFLFMHWLNPGYADDSYVQDSLGLVPRLLAEDSLLGIRNGQIDLGERVKEIRDFLYGWAKMRNLLRSENS